MIQLNYDKHNNVVLNYICKAISLLTSGYEEDLKIQFWKRTCEENANFIFLICLVEMLVVHTQHLSYISC